ncbi:redox-sensitive transcriptional activator SoxR [Alteromonas pelagimontana]|uniref:Redox-sensitive transcriptional activator SoxR n=1 Tax=Alteromonas pelagimontana TaxID=1858656 RepID=A0A6M4MGD1_9ALTE|nr:redox-sensitive transcriptional activator SoxR [Alteromonas pelagimontana]QJR82179.1 redox-sensitive transcriptional activator SoxR [Alteromonas pelagimontana]
MNDLSVGKVAERCGVNVSALHFYEKRGLIHSSRNAGNQRRYGRDTIRRVSLIKAAQQLGIALNELEPAFATLPKFKAPTPQQWQQMATLWEKKLAQRIQRLQRLQSSLTSCIGCGCLSMERCPLYNPDDTLAQDGPGPVLLVEADKEKWPDRSETG